MAKKVHSLTDLARCGDLKNLEDRWLTAIEQPDENRQDLFDALDMLIKNGKSDRAGELAWTWLTEEKERSEPADVLSLARELGLRLKNNTDLRQELIDLFEQVYEDRLEIETLIEVSGLKGERSVLRALRTLDMCLDLQVGDYLVSRSDEHAAQVTAIDPDDARYTVKTARSEDQLDADGLALTYDKTGEYDFRVLRELRPEMMQELIDRDPASFILGVLQSYHRHMDSDQLEHMLCPRIIPTGNWKKWWTRARTAIRRCPHIVIEGKNPIIMAYHAEGLTLEDKILPQWKEADSPAARLSVIDTYFREIRQRKTKADPAMIQRMHRNLAAKVKMSRKGAPTESLTEALVLHRLAADADVPDKEATLAREIIAESSDLVALLAGPVKNVSSLYLRALGIVKELHAEDWADVYGKLLPTASMDGCESIAQALIEAGMAAKLTAAAEMLPVDWNEHLDAICWLWRGSNTMKDIDVMTPREILPKLLSHLMELTLDEPAASLRLRDARMKIRAALSAKKYARYRDVIAQMEPGMASTVRRSIDRLDGLGQVVKSDLLRIVYDTHPELYVAKARVDPWEDDNVVFATQEGLEKRQAELDHLVNVKMKENAIAIGEAASRGDLSENSEYKFALEERDLLRARVARIQNEMGIAQVLTANDVTTEQVNIGTRIQLRRTDGQGTREITILGPFEASLEKHVYNYRAPLPATMKGMKPGDVVSLEFDEGEHEYAIESIANALDA